MSRLRTISKIERDGNETVLTLSCGHQELLLDFPAGDPPPCFRRECPEPHCAESGRHGRESIKHSYRAEGRNWVD